MTPQVIIAISLFAAISVLGLIALFLLLYRILTVMVSVTQELRWTAEAYSGRDYKREKEAKASAKENGDPDRVTIEPPWNDEMEAKS